MGHGASLLAIASLSASACRIGFGDPRAGDGGFDSVTADDDAHVDADVDAQTPYNLIFVTSQAFNGNLGGLQGADDKCATAAMSAGLPGHFRAWVSTPSVSAASRFVGARGWVRVDGKPFADTIESLTKRLQVFYPPVLDENGASSGAAAMTGTNADGTSSMLGGDGTCAGWTLSAGGNAQVGTARSGSVHWTNAAGGTCDQMFALYCMGIDYQRAVQVVPAVGRNAFVSAADWDPATGIGAADTLCQTEAGAAALANATSYKALIATSSTSAASRFNDTGAPWVRRDGIPLASTAAAWFDMMGDIPLDVHADGTYADQLFAVAYSGALAPRTAGSNATTCNNWSKNDATANVDFTDVAEPGLFVGYQAACNRWPGTSYVYCLEP